MKDKKSRVHLLVSGLVQGVFFRANTQKKAQKLGLTGWVKNLSDGRVEIVSEGPEERLEKFIQWVKQGPRTARVRNLDTEWEEFKGEFDEFEIRY